MIGFGIYLFIGLKGLIGLFSIGSLVCYTGSFMQVVQGVTAIANTTGQIPQIIPTLDYYFDILHTESGKQAGTLLPQMDTPVSIEFRNVSFKYPESETYALKNFSIKLEMERSSPSLGATAPERRPSSSSYAASTTHRRAKFF